jgi:hypothetical protein
MIMATTAPHNLIDITPNKNIMSVLKTSSLLSARQHSHIHPDGLLADDHFRHWQ